MYKRPQVMTILPFSSSCFFNPTVFGLPRPLRIGSVWLLARDLLLFSMSLVKEESILSLRMRSVLLRLKSSLSGAENTDDNYKTKKSSCEENLMKEKRPNI